VPAYADRRDLGRPRERAFALAAVVCVQAAIGLVLFGGLRVSISHRADVVEQLLNFTIAPPPPPPVPPPEPKRSNDRSSAPKAERAWLEFHNRNGDFEASLYGDEPVADLQVTQNEIFRIAERADALDKYLTIANDQ